MSIKRLFTACALALLSFVLIVSCSQQNPTSPSSVDSSSRLRVAMVLTGSHQDKSWSQGGYEGLKLIEKEYNAQTAYVENVENADSEAALRQYAQEGYDLVIGHSGGFIKAAETVAQEFPQTKFALITTYAGNNKNLGAVAFRSGEVGYLTGMLATMKTKTNKVGYIVGADYPVYQEEAALFKRGVKATNPSVTASTAFLGTWTDQAKAIKVAMEMVNSGVDTIAINADEAGIAAIEAIVKNPGVHVIGWTKDLHELAPDRVITSVLQDIPQLVLKAATLVQKGRWEGKLYKYGLEDKIYDFAPFRGSLTSEEESKFNAVRKQVIAGTIDVSP